MGKNICKKFLKAEDGITVEWLVIIIVGILLAVIVWKSLGEGVKSAAESMRDALIGE